MLLIGFIMIINYASIGLLVHIFHESNVIIRPEYLETCGNVNIYKPLIGINLTLFLIVIL